MKTLVLALAAVCLVLAIAACGGGGAESAGPVPSVPVEAAAAPGDEPLTFELWFIGWNSGGGCCMVFSTSRTAKELGIPHAGAAFAVGPHVIEKLVEALIDGVSPAEEAYGYTSVLSHRPPGSSRLRLLGVSIENGIATLNLSSGFEIAAKSDPGVPKSNPGFGMLFSLAQIVYTVTQFPEIEGVRFAVDGWLTAVYSGRAILGDGARGGQPPGDGRELLDRPVTREDYEGAISWITIEAPMIGAEVASPIRIAGTANVETGRVIAQVVDAGGSILAEHVAIVTCGAACRGDFEIAVPFEVSERQSGEIRLRSEGPSCTTTLACSTHPIPVKLLP